ncbi:uncharacterized, partial [Tachysurus ichikawai]
LFLLTHRSIDAEPHQDRKYSTIPTAWGHNSSSLKLHELIVVDFPHFLGPELYFKP